MSTCAPHASCLTLCASVACRYAPEKMPQVKAVAASGFKMYTHHSAYLIHKPHAQWAAFGLWYEHRDTVASDEVMELLQWVGQLPQGFSEEKLAVYFRTHSNRRVQPRHFEQIDKGEYKAQTDQAFSMCMSTLAWWSGV